MKDFLPYNEKDSNRGRKTETEIWVKGHRRYVITVLGVLTSKASLYREISQSLGVQFGQVRTRGLLVWMGLLQAKNSELGEVWLPRGADEKCYARERKTRGEHRLWALQLFQHKSERWRGENTGFWVLWIYGQFLNFAEVGNSGKINLLKDELHK